MSTTDRLITAKGTGLETFHPASREWFARSFHQPTDAQQLAWPHVAAGSNTLLLAPTGSGKTLAAFFVAVDRLMFRADATPGVKVLYISPLKALGVDVERNLRPPIVGVRSVAEQRGDACRTPTVAVRSGDTDQRERARMLREPPDILITTPESLYLLLTSKGRDTLATVDLVIIDEIHTLVASKRGAHLFVSLERLEKLRRSSGAEQPLQRIGLSATQRPLSEVARLLGGCDTSAGPNEEPVPRPVEIVDAGRRKEIDIRIEVPLEDLAATEEDPVPNGSSSLVASPGASIWPAIHGRLLELVRSHRSTMIFANSRRLAERLATSLNDLAEEEIAAAHHGSIAKESRAAIEDRLKRGKLPAIVATSSMELGVDMGAVDLVVQIEAPPSIASGIQRVGRSGHNVGDRSKAVVFPKYRADLLACAAATPRMLAGDVESTTYPRNPLDVLAQQLVAMVALDDVSVDDLVATIRAAAPFADLPRTAFESTLDLLSGRYPSDEFSELRPKLNWDRSAGIVSSRRGTQRTAILNAGTIPDRGLYGVFLAGEPGETTSRVGELDEEMVFETRPGDVFLLGASSWRVVEITRDRVLVVPAPGEPGRMPFWRGDGPGRPVEFGAAIGQLARELVDLDEEAARERLVAEHGLDEGAATSLLAFLGDQMEATGELPSDTTIVVERFLDEIGDWRICVLTPFGTRVHAPWAMVVAARLRERTDGEVDVTWTDDGLSFRLPDGADIPDLESLFPSADDVEDEVVRELGSTALFAARFRENAARALLLPRNRPGKRTPLWLQRRRAGDLLAVASRYPEFPILLETYRECLRDTFDVPGLKRLLRSVEQRGIRIRTAETRSASPFAASLLFEFTANFLYEGDAPLAERRARSLVLDHVQLRELLGDAEMRKLLDPAVIEETAFELQRLDERFAPRDADDLHDLLQHLGDLSREEIAARATSVDGGTLDGWLDELVHARRIVRLEVAGESRYAAAEDMARYRDALGIVPPPGLPHAFLEPVATPVDDLVSRFARTHAPFTVAAVVERFALATETVTSALGRLAEAGRVVDGEFLPSGTGREWCDSEVLRRLKRRSLAKLREEVEPVDASALGRFLPEWQGVTRPRRGADGVLDVVEQLQGFPLPASVLERDVLPARVRGYHPRDLDELCVAGEVVWQGLDSLGESDGRIALYLADDTPLLARRPEGGDDSEEAEDERPGRILELLNDRGALFFDELTAVLGGFPNEWLDVLWSLVWEGRVTNDTLAPLRSLARSRRGGRRRGDGRRRRERRPTSRFRSRRSERLPGSEGRWSLVWPPGEAVPTPTERQTALAKQLLERYGVVTREVVPAEGITGGFTAIYPILKAMEEAGRVRRGYFVAGQGGAQFAFPGAEDRLRHGTLGSARDDVQLLRLAALDPANPYGAALPWPQDERTKGRFQRKAGSTVLLRDGALIGYLGGGDQSLLTNLPVHEPDRTHTIRDLATLISSRRSSRSTPLITQIDGDDALDSPLRTALEDHGFRPSGNGLLAPRSKSEPVEPDADDELGPDDGEG